MQTPAFTSDAEPFVNVITSVDWDKHELGPVSEWPMQLQRSFHQIIPDSRANAVYWGPEYLAFYNEAFSELCGSEPSKLLGKSIIQLWPHLKDRLDEVWNSQSEKRTRVEDETRFFVETSDGLLEETYIKWVLNPILENQQCVGIQHSLVETTSIRLWERRMKFLIDLGGALITARDVQSYWATILEEFERWNPTYDVPLAFIYSVDEDDDNDSSRSRYDCPRICRLAGSLGVPEGHAIAPPVLELRDTDEGLAPSFREALQAQIALEIRTDNGKLPERLLEGLDWRGFGDACRSAVLCPLRPTEDENIMGVLCLGLNPRRPFDNDYKQFISLLHQKLTSSLASTVLLEEETRRGRNAAAQAAFDTAMLQRKLAWQTEKANQSIQNFQAVAEFIPVAVSITDNDGNVTFANDAWYRITGHPRGPIASDALLKCVVPEDKGKITQAYEQLNRVDVVTFEFRIPRDEPFDPASGARRHGSLTGLDDGIGRHVLASTKAERAADGSVARMLTCLTDVTQQKDTAEEAVRRAQEAENLKRLAESATVGMYDISVDGRLLSANDSFWELCGLKKVDLSKYEVQPWQACVFEPDLPDLQEKLAELRKTSMPQTAEIRLKTEWRAEDASGKAIASARSVHATFMPVKNTDGNVESFTGCISDVSLQTWQLGQEKQRKEEAIESKRQQENFIDMTSHEMRNPLSAIIHCTDAIVATLLRLEEIATTVEPMSPSKTQQSDKLAELDMSKKLLRDSIENAETILTCAQHQKRIVDDILTMSKLDSKLLAVTPCTVDPIAIVTDALKMFDVEARRVDIALTSTIDESYYALGHEFLDFDPSRVQQVLINLLTNALKFTKTGAVRNVQVCVKGSPTRPQEATSAVKFIPRYLDASLDYEQPALIGRTNPVYLMFEVKDTGQGLSEEEMKGLFNKFVQASAKTHVKYGGSGLGLFISRRLTELQNGAIGVASEVGVGSTFAFYIEAYVPSAAALSEALAASAAAKLVLSTELAAVPTLSENPAIGKRTGVEPSIARRLYPAARNVSWDGILVVEDNVVNQQVTRRGLMTQGFSVDVANHGIEALEKLRRAMKAGNKTQRLAPGSVAGLPEATQGLEESKESKAAPKLRSRPSLAKYRKKHGEPEEPIPINVVLMDMEMPIQDGLTCTRKIRELEASGEILCASGGKVPIIAVTANARSEQVKEAKEAGCDDVLVKPYRFPDLVEMMQVVIRRVGGLSPNSPAC
jgi:signal transduction histidine kinase/CheY-like chemotaxis protein